MGNLNSNKILIVDDEPNILVPLEFLMSQQGYEVSKATNGVEALQKVEQFRPSIVILDVMMPVMDGFEVAQKIRENPDYEDLRIIFLTAKGTTADKITGYSKGGEAYLTKPFDNDELISIVNEIVEYG